MSRTIPVVLAVALVGGLVGCDHATKHLARTEIRPRGAVTVVRGVLSLRYVENRDSGFNLLRPVPAAVRRPLLLVVNLCAVPLLAVLWLRRRGAGPAEGLGWGLVLAGALGNLLDRIGRGYVVDFIHVHYWPVFNVADVCLVCGTLLLLWRSRPWQLLARAPRPGPL
jgi:signal peptidase II